MNFKQKLLLITGSLALGRQAFANPVLPSLPTRMPDFYIRDGQVVQPEQLAEVPVCLQYTMAQRCWNREACETVCQVGTAVGGNMVGGNLGAGIGAAVGTQCSRVCKIVPECTEYQTCVRYSTSP